jgi:hypothetical protein
MARDDVAAVLEHVDRGFSQLHDRVALLEELLTAVARGQGHGGNRRFEALLAGHERRLARLEKPSR